MAYTCRAAWGLNGSQVKASTTIGFPHGGHTTAIKLAEARQALSDGCQEPDMVVSISKVLSGDWGYVRDGIGVVIDAAHNDDQKIRLCEICGELRADWVKTSTGYGTGGATMKDLMLMRRHAPDYAQVKAAGGVRDLDALLRVRALGVTRVGATRTAEMLDECRRRLEGLPAVV